MDNRKPNSEEIKIVSHKNRLYLVSRFLSGIIPIPICPVLPFIQRVYFIYTAWVQCQCTAHYILVHMHNVRFSEFT